LPPKFAGISDPIRDWRNRTLQSEKFQRFARRNVLTRWMARRRARQLFDLCAGFVYSQVLDACVSLDLFKPLADGPRSRDFLAKHANLPADRCEVLLRSAIALQLLEARGPDHVALGIHGAALLANPGVSNMIRHHKLFYADVQDPVSLFRNPTSNTHLAALWDYSTPADQLDEGVLAQRAHYTQLMSTTQTVVAEQIVDCVPLADVKHLLDVGGSDGTFLRSVGRVHEAVQLSLFDLPVVVEQAKPRFEAEGFGHRVRYWPGNMHTDALPTGPDAISLIRVLHDHDDAESAALLSSCQEALPKGGRLILAEPMGLENRGDPATDTYFGFYFRAMGRGRCRTAEENRRLLVAAGFQKVTEIKTAMPFLARVLMASV
jgi:demethylspheroidene O-methyltransferase